MPFIGGAASISGGQVVAQVGSRNDSVEAMIKDFRANGTNLAATVSHYNGFVKAGKDADFDRPVQYMKAEIAAKGPYYIVEQKPRFATTMGGVMGDDSPAGANVGWALTSGRVAADAAAVAIKAGK
jgi:urocanate reductase